MRIIIVAGAPASGKTSVLVHTIKHLKQSGKRPGVVKMDCLRSEDERIYSKLDVPVITGLSGHICPDHYLAINMNNIYTWAKEEDVSVLIVETAGLCNRCAPFIDKALNVCVIDSTSSIKSPEKLGPMVTTASVIILTKCDMLSQAEREILLAHLRELNDEAHLSVINGVTGAGARSLLARCDEIEEATDMEEAQLIYQMPGAICSYCVGETRIGNEYHQGMVEYMTCEVSKQKGCRND